MFKTELDVRARPPNLWLVLSPLVWDDRLTTEHGKGFGRVEFPAAFITDLGSTPQLLHFIKYCDPTCVGRRSAVGHDYLYANGKWPDGRTVTRAEADEFLRVGMISEGHAPALARSWWFGVRSGGWLPWNRYRRAEVDR